MDEPCPTIVCDDGEAITTSRSRKLLFRLRRISGSLAPSITSSISSTARSFLASSNGTQLSLTPASSQQFSEIVSEHTQTKTHKAQLPLPDENDCLGGLHLYSKAIDDRAWTRFYDVLPRLQAPVSKALSKVGSEGDQVAFRLVVLGRDEPTAKPTIVVLCTRKAAREVQRALLHDDMRNIYQSPFHTIQFGVVFGDPMILTSAHMIFRPEKLQDIENSTSVNFLRTSLASANETLCGTHIVIVPGDNVRRLATIGGIIRVGVAGRSNLYCMVACHPFMTLVEPSTGVTKTGMLDVQSREMSRDVLNTRSSTHARAGDRNDCATDNTVSAKATSTMTAVNGCLITQGSMLSAKIILPSSRRGCDWALIAFDDPRYCKPNDTCGSREGNLNNAWGSAVKRDSGQKAVFMLDAGDKPRHGVLSMRQTLIRTGGDVEMVSVFVLSLVKGAVIVSGDSGSWVVGANSRRVYGHLVARDMFGDGYVIPLQTTFDDIADCFDADIVDLPDSAHFRKIPRHETSKHTAGIDWEIQSTLVNKQRDDDMPDSDSIHDIEGYDLDSTYNGCALKNTHHSGSSRPCEGHFADPITAKQDVRMDHNISKVSLSRRLPPKVRYTKRSFARKVHKHSSHIDPVPTIRAKLRNAPLPYIPRNHSMSCPSSISSHESLTDFERYQATTHRL